MGLSLFALFFASGCGDMRIILVVDVLSYLDEDESGFSYGDDGPIPPGIPEAVVFFEPDTLSFSEGLAGATDVDETTVWLTVHATNETGTAMSEIFVYMSALDEDPFTTVPIATLHFDLSPGSVDSASAVVDSEPRLGELLLGSEALLAVKIDFDTSQSDDSVKGEVEITELLLRVVARRSGL